jgi:hypothetical protein
LEVPNQNGMSPWQIDTGIQGNWSALEMRSVEGIDKEPQYSEGW